MADDHEAQDVKPDAKDGTINIKVRGQDQTLLQFKVPRTDTPTSYVVFDACWLSRLKKYA